MAAGRGRRRGIANGVLVGPVDGRDSDGYGIGGADRAREGDLASWIDIAGGELVLAQVVVFDRVGSECSVPEEQTHEGYREEWESEETRSSGREHSVVGSQAGGIGFVVER